MAETEDQTPPAKPKKTGRLGFMPLALLRGWMLKIGAICLLLLAVPVLFIFIYALPGTTPLSTPIAGRLITGKPTLRSWVNIEEVSPFVWQSVVMSEDGQFCSHHGIDMGELRGVVDDALAGARPRGASTITMQTIKNLYLWPQRSLIRKVLELPYALIADKAWGKRRTMELYLNIAEFAEGIYGIEAASRYYFMRSADKLTRRQAALLATSLPNPKVRDAFQPSKTHRKLARRIERLARKSGAYVTCLQ